MVYSKDAHTPAVKLVYGYIRSSLKERLPWCDMPEYVTSSNDRVDDRPMLVICHPKSRLDDAVDQALDGIKGKQNFRNNYGINLRNYKQNGCV